MENCPFAGSRWITEEDEWEGTRNLATVAMIEIWLDAH